MWKEVVLFAGIGFVAQVVDAALGMAYGAATMLLSLGVAPSVASASAHAAEVFTAGVSGSAHWCLGNIELALVRRLALAGIVGGATGAYVLKALPGSFIRLFVSMYLLGMGLVIVWRAIGRLGSDRWTSASGPGGDFDFDRVGDDAASGHWFGKSSSVLCSQRRYVDFRCDNRARTRPIIVGLMTGGALAASLAAFAARRLPQRALMLLVGIAIVLLSPRSLLQSLR